MTDEQKEKLLPQSPHDDEKRKPSAPLFLGFQDRMNMEYFRSFMHTTSPAHAYQETPLKELEPNYPMNGGERSIKMDYVYFPLKLVKIQKRENKVSMQRIEDGNVSFALDFETEDHKSSVKGIHIGVKRTSDTGYNSKSVGTVPIPAVELSHIQETKILVKLDLDSVHTYEGKKVYELDRNKEEENLFNLVIEVQYFNGDTIKQDTRSFKLIGRKCSPPTIAGGKRSFSDSNSPSSPDSGLENTVAHTISVNTSDAADSPGYRMSPTVDENVGLIEARMIVAEHIKTRFLDVDGQAINLKAITTPNGDIAYHFLLENDDDVFEEGEIVGFVPDGHSDKKQIVTKLTFKSASRAILKGVVTRSQYLEAQKPSPGVRSETIAMMGIVPVQVRGSVCANEPLYASPHHPGFAVSGYQLDSITLNEAAFIGYAFSGRKAVDDHSAGMVQAAVSILQSAGQKLLSERVKLLEDQFEEKIININRFGRRTRQCVYLVGFTMFLILFLLGILLWQLLVPGTALRYHMCTVGRKVPYADSYFSFQPWRDIKLNPTVHGIAFEFNALMEKAGHVYHPINETINGTGFRYYLNLDRCAYGYVSKGDIPRGIKPIRGPTVFAVDEKCYRPYYFDESKNRFVGYNSARWDKYKNICCVPKSKWKTCEEIQESRCKVKPKCDAG